VTPHQPGIELMCEETRGMIQLKPGDAKRCICRGAPPSLPPLPVWTVYIKRTISTVWVTQPPRQRSKRRPESHGCVCPVV
jgi:hypothetical protein